MGRRDWGNVDVGQGHICGAAARWGRGAASALVSSRHVATYDRSYGDDDSVKRGARSCILGLIVRFQVTLWCCRDEEERRAFLSRNSGKGCGKRREEKDEE